MTPHMIMSTQVRLTVIGAVTLSLLTRADSMDNSDRCVNNFQVWAPDQDILTKVHKLEDKCEKMSSYLDHQVMLITNRMLDELLQARNLTHGVEKDLLGQKLADVQLNIAMKDVKMDIMDMRGENRKLWEAVERGPMRGSSGGGGGGGRGRASNAHVQQISTEVNDMGLLVNQLKNGVGDLKAEWLLIKREVQDIKSESLQLKFGQNDMKADAEKLKDVMENIKTDTKSLKTQSDDLISMHDKLKKSVSELKGEGAQNRIQNQLDELKSITGHQDGELSKLRVQLPQVKHAMEVALANRNISADDISAILTKLPNVHGGAKSERKNYIKQPKGSQLSRIIISKCLKFY